VSQKSESTKEILSYNNMGDPGGHYTKRNKSDTEYYMWDPAFKLIETE
jgi:hypothetical protein